MKPCYPQSVSLPDPLWLPKPRALSLPAAHLHIWRVSLDLSQFQIGQLEQILSADERQRVSQFKFERNRRQFIACRGYLRYILGKYLREMPGQLFFSYGPYGKPLLADEKRLFFNVTHSGELALYAVTRTGPVGIDTEYIRPMSNADQIADDFFSAEEAATIRSLPPDQRSEAFFRIWTCKEAYLKATGEGLAGLKNAILSHNNEKAGGYQTRLSASGWTLRQFLPMPGYIGAVAVKGGTGHVSWFAASGGCMAGSE